MASSIRRVVSAVLLVLGHQGTAQRFQGGTYSVSYPGIRPICASALNTTLDCPRILGGLVSSKIFLTPPQLESLCTASCSTSLQNARIMIQRACNSSEDVIPVSGTKYPAIWLPDSLILAFNSSCIKDPTTGIFCDTIIQSEDEDTASEDLMCSDCVLGTLTMELNSPVGYSNESAKEFESVTASCSATGYSYSTPSLYTAYPTTTFASNSSATATPSCAAQYEVEDGDTCTSIALSQNVSNFWLTYTNHIDAFCALMPSAGTKLCLPEPCSVYTVKEKQTCMDIIQDVADRITVTQLQTWNPNINRLCGNVERMNGSVICVSPPGGYLPHSNSTGADPAAETPVPVPSNIGNGTSTECAQYYTAKKGDFCAALSVRFDIPLDDLYSLNKGLESSNCTNLEAGKAYCVQAVRGADAVATASISGMECMAASPPSSCFVDTSTLSRVPNIAGNWSTPPMPMISTSLAESTIGALPTSSPIVTGTTPKSTIPASTAPSSSNSSGIIPTPMPSTSASSALGSGNATSTSPAPTQSGAISDCSEFYTVQEGDTCTTIEEAYSVTLQDLQFWNSDIGEQCENLLVGFSICVHGPPLPTSSSTTPATSASVAPTQTSGIATDCTAFYTVQQGDSCDSIEETNSISFEQFHAWNPSIGDICEDLLVGFQYCVAGPPVPTPTSAPPPSSVSVAPTQTSGVTDSCSEYYTIQQGDSCDSIEQDRGITFEQFYGWNPSIGDNCENLLVGFQYCVAAA